MGAGHPDHRRRSVVGLEALKQHKVERRARLAAGVFISALALVLSGCAGMYPQTATLRGGLPAGMPEQVELKQVSFRYGPHAPQVLHDITVRIEPGQKVALVGRTGSGKSTLGRILLGLHLPTQGDVLYDDISLRTLNYQAVRSQFGVVLQESTLFSGSVRDNIALNHPDIDLAQVVKAARAAAIPALLPPA